MQQLVKKGDLLYLEPTCITSIGGVQAFFTTKHGGVSSGDYYSLNLGFNRGDFSENVFKNYEIVATTAGFKTSEIFRTRQVHKTDIKLVTKADTGLYDKEGEQLDGLVTNEKGVVLCAYFADCVPIFAYDKNTKSIGVFHAGWRGTADNIAGIGIKKMAESFNANTEDIVCFIGPCISKCHFEAKDDVYSEFYKALGDKINDFTTKNEGNYNIDLKAINKYLLQETGVLEKNIFVSDICTYCESDTYYSHRKSGDKRGTMAAFIRLI